MGDDPLFRRRRSALPPHAHRAEPSDLGRTLLYCCPCSSDRTTNSRHAPRRSTGRRSPASCVPPLLGENNMTAEVPFHPHRSPQPGRPRIFAPPTPLLSVRKSETAPTRRQVSATYPAHLTGNAVDTIRTSTRYSPTSSTYEQAGIVSARSDTTRYDDTTCSYKKNPLDGLHTPWRSIKLGAPALERR